MASCVPWLAVRMTHLSWHLLYCAEKQDFLLFWESFELVYSSYSQVITSFLN